MSAMTSKQGAPTLSSEHANLPLHALPAGRSTVAVRAASSKKGQKAETVEYGESWYEQTRRLGAKPGRTVREELGKHQGAAASAGQWS